MAARGRIDRRGQLGFPRLLVLALAAALLCAVSAASLERQKLAVERRLKRLNKPAIQTIQVLSAFLFRIYSPSCLRFGGISYLSGKSAAFDGIL